MPVDEIKPSDIHCGGCDFYLGLGECALPPGCCVLADSDAFDAVPDWDSTYQMIQIEGGTS